LPRSEKIGSELAQNPEQALAKLRENLGKFGNTLFVAEPVELNLTQAWFLPVSAVNALRREATENLETARIASHQRPPRATPAANPVPYPQEELTYLGNVFNAKARQFYEKHGVKLIEEAYEAGNEKGMVSLMITRHCLRYSFNLCPKEVKHLKPDPMTLMNGNEKLILKFDCKACEMHVIGKMKKGVKLNLGTIRQASCG
jgi:putative protease